MPDLAHIAGLIRETAAIEILPRFGALASGDIREKSPGDLVTVADTAAERRLTRLLEDAVPGSVTLGEEAAAADASCFDRLAGAAPVWIVDPIDGTGNFVRGQTAFAVIVAYVEGGRTECGWIYDPLRDVMVAAVRGGGVWSEGRRLTLGATPSRIIGAAYGRNAEGTRAGKALIDSGRIAGLRNHGCSGVEYIEVALGLSHFSLHSRSLPWDHAAGMLMVAEAGGSASFLDGSPYDPRIRDRAPLAAASRAVWESVAAVMTGDAA